MPFTLEVLTVGEWTHAEAEVMERCYRLVAQRKGFHVYGLPHVFINPQRRATGYERMRARTLPWPNAKTKKQTAWPYVLAGLILAMLALTTLWL